MHKELIECWRSRWTLRPAVRNLIAFKLLSNIDFVNIWWLIDGNGYSPALPPFYVCNVDLCTLGCLWYHTTLLVQHCVHFTARYMIVLVVVCFSIVCWYLWSCGIVKFTQLCCKFPPTALLNFACDWLAFEKDISFGLLTSPNVWSYIPIEN